MYIMLKPEYFGYYNLEYNIDEVLVSSVAQFQDILGIQFNQNFLEKIMIDGDSNIVYQKEID
jgi:hypothetical protein